MSQLSSTTLLTPPATPRSGPVSLPDIDDVGQGPVLCEFPAGNALCLFVNNPPPDGDDFKRKAWTHVAERRRLKRAGLRRTVGRRRSVFDALEDASRHEPTAAPATAGAPQGSGQLAQTPSQVMPQPVMNATTGEAGSI